MAAGAGACWSWSEPKAMTAAIHDSSCLAYRLCFYLSLHQPATGVFLGCIYAIAVAVAVVIGVETLRRCYIAGALGFWAVLEVACTSFPSSAARPAPRQRPGDAPHDFEGDLSESRRLETPIPPGPHLQPFFSTSTHAPAAALPRSRPRPHGQLFLVCTPLRTRAGRNHGERTAPVGRRQSAPDISQLLPGARPLLW
jgi:hypothetical protein